MTQASKPDDFANDLDKLTNSVDRLRLDLAELGCSTKGNKEKLQKRLKEAKKSLKSSQNERQNDQNGYEKEKSTTEDAQVLSRYSTIRCDSCIQDCSFNSLYPVSTNICHNSLLITTCFSMSKPLVKKMLNNTPMKSSNFLLY
jgi:NAD-dependent dihydropyrimidine dehydrogenase PreA subunit